MLLYNKRGKVRIYYRLLNNEGGDKYIYGIHQNERRKVLELNVPLALEMSNTTNTARIIRNTCVSLYNGRIKVCELQQMTHTYYPEMHSNGEMEIKEKAFGADNQSYSFVLQPTSIQKQICLFTFDIADTVEEKRKFYFDSMYLEYYNENDQLKSYKIAEITDSWEPKILECSDDWRMAGRFEH